MLTAGLNDLEGHLQPEQFYESMISLQLRMKDTYLCEICFYFVNVLLMNMSNETTANAAVKHCTLHRECGCLVATAGSYFYSEPNCSVLLPPSRHLGGFFSSTSLGDAHTIPVGCGVWVEAFFFHLLSQKPCTIMAGMGIFLQ